MPGIATALFQLTHTDGSLQVVKSVFTCPPPSLRSSSSYLCVSLGHGLTDSLEYSQVGT